MLSRFFVKVLLAFRSRTVWSILALLAAQLPAFRNQVSPTWQAVIDGVLALLAIYFRLNPNPVLEASLNVVSAQ